MADRESSAADMIVLQEFETVEAPLAPAARTMLQSRYANQIEVTATGQPGVYRIAARQHVGRISLPGGGMLVIRPKVGVTNLFYMLSAEPRLARDRKSGVE